MHLIVVLFITSQFYYSVSKMVLCHLMQHDDARKSHDCATWILVSVVNFSLAYPCNALASFPETSSQASFDFHKESKEMF